MNPKTRRSCSSTSLSPQHRQTTKEDYLKSRHSLSKLNLNAIQKNADETLFDTLMNDPAKRTLLLRLLSQEKDNIEKYKRDEEKKNLAKLETTERRFRKRQRLLHCESPTALLRRKALLQRDRCDSDSSSSTTSESISVASSTIPFNELLKGIVAYVEIRSKEGDRSAGAKALMQSMGATIVDKFGRGVTHVLFKDGSFCTYQRAKLMKAHLVSVLWLEAVRKHHARVPEKNYPALGTDAYDANISAICQDYEEVVRDEYRRSKALNGSKTTVIKSTKGRKTAVPYELHPQKTANESTSSSTSFHTAERVSDIIPSSQDWEAESVISSESSYPPFRRLLSSAIDEGSDRLLTTSPDLTSDASSDCGVVNGHSVKHIRDSLLDDLNVLVTQNACDPPPANDGEASGVQTSIDTSSSRSISLLSRKSLLNRKSSHSVVDMDLTRNVVIGREKSNVDLEDTDKENVESTPKRSTKTNKRALSSDNSIIANGGVESVQKMQSKRQKTVKSANKLKLDTPDSSTDHTTLGTTRSSGSLTRILFKRPIRNRNGGQKSSLESNEDVSKLEEPAKLSNKNRDTVEVHQSKKNSLDSGKGSNKRKSSLLSDKSKKTSASSEVLEQRKRYSSGSEVMPSLRISADSSKNSVEGKTNLNSKQLSTDREPSESTSGGTASKKDSLNSEDLPTFRISTESLPKDPKTGDYQPILNSSISNQGSGSTSKPAATATNGCPNLKVVLTRIISLFESPRTIVEDTGAKGDGTKSDKNAKLQSEQKKKGKTTEGKNRRVRKLFNLNQSITDVAKNWNLIDPSTNNKENPSTSSVNEPVSKKALVVPLTPILLTHTAKKFLKSQKLNAKSNLKTTKQQEPAKPKKAPKHVRKLYVDEEKDEQKELTEEFVTNKDKVAKRKCGDEEGSETPKKTKQGDGGASPERQMETQRRRSQRLCLPIKPQLNRRSTLDFVQTTQSRKQAILSQKSKKNRSSIVCTRMHKPEVQEFMQIVRKLGSFYVEDEVSEKTTHLIVGESKRTINLLRAIGRGCWIVTKEWLYRSLEAGQWLPEEDFELTDFSPSVQQCRIQQQAFGRLFSMDIFANCGPIYIARGSLPRRSDLEELVKLCKGRIAKLTYNASIVVGEWVRYEQVVCVSETWVLDSITFNKRKSFKNYLLKQNTLAVSTKLI